MGDLDNILTPADLGVVEVSDDGNYVDLMFPDPGTFEFGYIVTNNFGCTWDTTLTVEVIDNPGTFITAGVDLEYCGGEIQLQGRWTTGRPWFAETVAGTYNHCYGYGDNTVFSYCPDNAGRWNHDDHQLHGRRHGGILGCCDGVRWSRRHRTRAGHIGCRPCRAKRSLPRTLMGAFRSSSQATISSALLGFLRI